VNIIRDNVTIKIIKIINNYNIVQLFNNNININIIYKMYMITQVLFELQ
jgi:hypothetical protein